jgi:16S rRNA (adenine(1408)-N(1))-methyltransferase
MTLTRVVGPGRTVELSRAQLDELRDRAARTVVDVGAGDGRYAYALATRRPDTLVVAMDALDAPLAEVARRARRKPARGGRPNLVLVRASVEALPDDLQEFADEVHVVLPWGRLLEGIVLAERGVLSGIAALCVPGGRVAVTLNAEIWHDSMPERYGHLPNPSAEYVRDVVAAGFAAVGVALEPARELTAAEARALPSSWARRLGRSRARAPRFVHFEGVRNPPI